MAMNLLCLVFVLFCLMHFVATNSYYKALFKPISKQDCEWKRIHYYFIRKQILKCVVKKLEQLKDDEDPTLYSGQFEGDIVMSPEQMEILYGGTDDDPLRRNGE